MHLLSLHCSAPLNDTQTKRVKDWALSLFVQEPISSTLVPAFLQISTAFQWKLIARTFFGLAA